MVFVEVNRAAQGHHLEQIERQDSQISNDGGEERGVRNREDDTQSAEHLNEGDDDAYLDL
eukprot:7083391-Prymnesium_polylepis.1